MKTAPKFMPTVGILTILATSGIGCSGSTPGSNTPIEWPSFQEGLGPGESSSQSKAAFPGAGINIVPPERSVAAEKAAYSGVWKGWMCRDAVVDVKLAVETAHNNGAMVVYASASDVYRFNYNERVNMDFIAGELRGKLLGGNELTFAIRKDGHLNAKWVNARNRDNWCTGILAK